MGHVFGGWSAGTGMMLLRLVPAIIVLLMVGAWPSGVPAQALPEYGEEETRPSTMVLSGLLQWEAETRSDIHRLIMAVPRLPAELSTALGRVGKEGEENGLPPLLIMLGLIVLAGMAGEWIVRRLLQPIWQGHHPARHSVIEVLPLVTFVLISGFLYFALDWPPLTGAMLFFYLAAAILFRLIWALCSIARITGTLTAFAFRRSLLFAGILLSALTTHAAAKALPVSADAGQAVAIVFSLPLLAICLEAAWRHAVTSGFHILRRKVLYTAALLALWLVWLLGLHIVFWIGVYAIALPILLPFVERLTHAYVAAHWPGDTENSVPAVITIRGLRALIISLAVLWLIGVWYAYPNGASRLHSLLDGLTLGLFRSVIILLVADLGWNVAKVMIDRKLASVGGSGPLSSADAAHRARLRTLLPIFRNGLAALILVITVLTVLAELGVEIAPLIAGAGIFGVAIGFGSQTLVKDMISGLLYLVDDAFRVGEYIQSGSYKGTVESFSLRSIRLRHHRGAIFTVPFGELGAVQNMSRDWAIDKFLLRLNFDADIPKVKMLVKTVGEQLLADPELGPLIIETLKLKGVEQIGDFGVELSFAFTAVPGNQSMIRRHAQAIIRETFIENGIGFAQPTVQLGGYGRRDTAAILAMAKIREDTGVK